MLLDCLHMLQSRILQNNLFIAKALQKTVRFCQERRHRLQQLLLSEVFYRISWMQKDPELLGSQRLADIRFKYAIQPYYNHKILTQADPSLPKGTIRDLDSRSCQDSPTRWGVTQHAAFEHDGTVGTPDYSTALATCWWIVP